MPSDSCHTFQNTHNICSHWRSGDCICQGWLHVQETCWWNMWQAWELHGQGALCLNPSEGLTVAKWSDAFRKPCLAPGKSDGTSGSCTILPTFCLNCFWLDLQYLLQYKDDKMTLRPQSRSGSPWGAFDPSVFWYSGTDTFYTQKKYSQIN